MSDLNSPDALLLHALPDLLVLPPVALPVSVQHGLQTGRYNTSILGGRGAWPGAGGVATDQKLVRTLRGGGGGGF
jgi:hypothetical protein